MFRMVAELYIPERKKHLYKGLIAGWYAVFLLKRVGVDLFID